MTSTNEWDARDETTCASQNASIPLPRRDGTRQTLLRIERKKLLLPQSASHPPRVQLLVAGGVVEPKVREYTRDSPRLRIPNVADEPDACLEINRPSSEAPPSQGMPKDESRGNTWLPRAIHLHLDGPQHKERKEEES